MTYPKRIPVIIAVLLLIITPAWAQDISPALEDQLDGLEDYARRTRQLEELTPVERVFPTRREALDYVFGVYDAEFSDEDARLLSLFYAAFDLLPPGTDYLEVYLELLGSQLGGFYDPETGQMHTILLGGGTLGNSLPLLEQIIYVHEYTHALQDQHFDLIALQELPGDNIDRMLAVLSLIEGDATLVMNVYTQAVAQSNPFGTAARLLTQGALTGTLTIPPGIPPIIERELTLPYEAGLGFVRALYAAGGWATVNAAFADPPQSMAQVLHPEKYLNGQAPLVVVLEDSGLGDEWELAWDNTLGEFYLTEHLRTQLPARDAASAAAGWSGDNFHIYHNAADDQLAWVLLLAWETEEDADEFAAAYAALGAARSGGGDAVDGCWQGPDDTLCMVTAGAMTTVITLAPTLEMAQALAARQR